MARVTVEDCIDKVDSPYELVLVAKERATQLNAGIEPTLDRDNDKNTVISLREIAEETIKVSDLTESAVYKLRKHVEQVDDPSILAKPLDIPTNPKNINAVTGVSKKNRTITDNKSGIFI